MAELRSLLAFMDPEDRERALRRYEQLFDRAGEAGEEMLLQELGSPVRQVLEVDREYRRAKKEGKLIYSEELPNLIPAAEEMIPEEKEAAPADLGQAVRKAAAMLEKYAEPQEEDSDAASDGEEDLFPIADLDYLDVPMPEEGAIKPVAGGSEKKTESEPRDFSDWEEEGHAPSPREPFPGSAEPIPADDDSEVERIIQFAADAGQDGGKKPEKSREPARSGPGALRVIAAILITVPLILLWAAGLALSLALGAVMMAVGFAFCAAGVYFAGYAINGYVAFMPDLLLVCGGALGCFALALFFLWFGLWFAVGGCAALVRVSAGVYRGILKKRRQEDEDDE